MPDKMIFHKIGLISGAAGFLDSISGIDRGDTNPLQTDDAAFVMVSGSLYTFLYDETSTAAESSPDVIRPDDIAAIDPGRWIIQSPALTIADASITNAKLAHIATSTIKGRVAAGTGDVEDLSAANVRTIINVADGANAYVHPNHSGDVTSAADGATTIAAKAVDVAMLADGIDGELITWGTDAVATVIAVGDAGDVLTSGGAGAVPTWEAPTGVTYATANEINTGTEVAKAINPDKLAASNFGCKVVQIVVFDYTTDVAAGNGKAYFVVPTELTGMNLVRVAATVITAGVTGSTTIAIYNLTDTHEMLSVLMNIETTETSTRTSATPGTIDTGEDDVVTGDVLRIDVDSISTTAPKGLIVELVFQLP
jgi:hypothetical protein